MRKLYEAAQLFEGGHVGADYSPSDLPFQILIVPSSSRNRRARSKNKPRRDDAGCSQPQPTT